MADPAQLPEFPEKTNEELVEEAISATLAAAIRAKGWALRADLTAHAADLMTLRGNLDIQAARAARAAAQEDED